MCGGWSFNLGLDIGKPCWRMLMVIMDAWWCLFCSSVWQDFVVHVREAGMGVLWNLVDKRTAEL